MFVGAREPLNGGFVNEREVQPQSEETRRRGDVGGRDWRERKDNFEVAPCLQSRVEAKKSSHISYSYNDWLHHRPLPPSGQ